MNSLTNGQVIRVVNRYIGVSAGYLGDFSYTTHHEFYPEYCDLDYNPYEIEGTTRERFIHILSNAPPEHQARILRGIVERFPIGDGPASRSLELRDELIAWASQLEQAAPVPTPDLQITSAVVQRALADADVLLSSTGATSSVDRVHTAMHGYLEAVCRNAGIDFEPNSTMNVLFNNLRQHHPKLRPSGPRADDITQVLRASGSILNALNPVRNRASVAHPNENLLDSPEAMLVVNVIRTILAYFEMRLVEDEN